MKRLVFLLVLALVLMPALALAEGEVATTDVATTDGACPPPPPPPINNFADVKAYGNQSAEYGTGVMLVDPGFESGWAVTDTKSVAVDITSFCAENNSPGCYSDCGMNVGQLKFNASCTDNFNFTYFENCYTSFSSSGMADMSSLGGVSLCATNANASGCLFQTQTVDQSSYGGSMSICPSFSYLGASSSYYGTQTIGLHVDNDICVVK